MMHLDICQNISVKKRHKLIIRHECVGMLRIKGLLHLLEYPELTGSQKGSQCFNLSNKKPENGISFMQVFLILTDMRH